MNRQEYLNERNKLDNPDNQPESLMLLQKRYLNECGITPGMHIKGFKINIRLGVSHSGFISCLAFKATESYSVLIDPPNTEHADFRMIYQVKNNSEG